MVAPTGMECMGFPITFVRRVIATGGALVALAFALAAPASAETPKAPASLGDMSIEDVLNLEITSASRHEERAIDAPAAVYVITQDDIRRSGLTLIPEILRLAPDVQVARINANMWAIAIRGFDTRWSDKLLVLVDGRSVYNRLFSGVYWDTLDLPVEDIERIEVISGPGGSVWGSNAVNGVINIITKS